MAAFLVYNQRKGIRYMVSRRRILGFAIGKMLRQDGWAEKYNPKNRFHVNQYDYSRCKEYLAALKEKWQEYEDPECEFEDYVNVSNYSNYDDYAYDVDVYRTRLEWRDEWDCDCEFEVNPCDFEYEEYYVKALKRAWKKELDPYDEFEYIDLELIDDVNEYKDRIDECKEWKDEHDSNDEYNVDPSQFDDVEEYLDALRSCWQDKYDPSFNCDIDVGDYDTEEDYRNALIIDWQDTYDPQHRFNGFKFNKFTTIDDYLVELDDRMNWTTQCDPEGMYSKIDASNYDNLIQYKHQIN